MTAWQAMFNQLDQFVAERIAWFQTPALALALFDRQRVLKVSTFGSLDLAAKIPTTQETLFPLGSIGKSFTGIAILQAVELGLIDLDAPVTRYLPWFAVQSSHASITVHHLLTHSAGLIRGTDATPSAQSEVWSLRATPAGFAPGTHFSYSDVGYKALGLILEAATGHPYAELVQTNILDPLGMTASIPSITNAIRARCPVGYRPLYDDRPAHRNHSLVPAAWVETDTADGCLAATIGDMTRYAQMLLNHGHGPHGRVLSDESFRLLTQPYIEQPHGWSYGYGVDVFEQTGFKHIGHGGDVPGYEAYMWLDLDNGLGVVVLSAQPYPLRVPFASLQMLRAAYLDQPLPTSPVLPELYRVPNANEYAGVFSASGKQIVVVAEFDHLWLQHDGERIALEGRGDDTFYADHPLFERYLLQFVTNHANGQRQAVEVLHGPDWYVSEQYDGPRTYHRPPHWDAYVGHYRAHNPWDSNFRIVVRKDELLLITPTGDEETLTELEPGLFCVGDVNVSPERLRFDQIVDGHALRAVRSGCPYFRFFTP